MARKPSIESVKTTGELLAEVRAEIRIFEERKVLEAGDMFDREKLLKEKLLADLKSVGLASFKAASGETYSITKTFDYSITNPIAYDKYARDNRCVRVDATAMKQRIRAAVGKGEELSFIDIRPRETISIRSPKKEATSEAET